MDELALFKEELKELVDGGFNNVPVILSRIKESGFTYEKVEYADFVNRGMSKLVSLDKTDYLIQLKIYIDHKITENESLSLISKIADSKNLKAQIDEEKLNNDFYNHFFEFPYIEKEKSITIQSYVRGGISPNSIIVAFGDFERFTTKVLNEVEIRTPDYKFEWFAEHLFPRKLLLKGNKHVFKCVRSSHLASGAAVCENIIQKIAPDNLPEYGFDSPELALQTLLHTLIENLQDASYAFPILLESMGELDMLNEFIATYWNPLTEKLNESEVSHKFMLLILIKESISEFSWSGNIPDGENIFLKIEKLETSRHESIKNWVDYDPGIGNYNPDYHAFLKYENHNQCCIFIKNFRTQPNNFYPPCQTIEGFFQIIAHKVLQIENFKQFLKQRSLITPS